MADTGLITLSRTIKATPLRVYDVLVSPDARRIWAPPDDGSILVIDGQPTPAPGVREVAQVGPAESPYVDATTDWILMEPGQRLVYSEMLQAEGMVLGISFATLELEPDGQGTALQVTVQIVSFTGEETMGEMESGWTHALDSLVSFAERTVNA